MITSRRHKSSKVWLQKILLGFLVVVTFGLLATIGYLLVEKFSSPISLAKYVPEAETFFFAEVRTRKGAAWEEWKQIYRGLTPTELFGLEQFNFPALAELAPLAQTRIGVAFFGTEFEPQKYLFVLDVADRERALGTLNQSALAGETLAMREIEGAEVFSYPQSHAQAFAFVGRDLLLASDVDILTLALMAQNGEIPRIADSKEYRDLIATLNPRAGGFGYFSGNALTAFLSARFSGLENALATPFVGLFASGGVSLTPENNGIDIQTFFALRPENIRQNFFTNTKPYRSKLVNVVQTNAQTFYATRNLSDTLASVLKMSEALNPNFALLAHGTLDALAQKFFGAEINYHDELAELLNNEVIVGTSVAGNGFVLLSGDGIATKFRALKDKILAGNSTLLATETAFMLPDGSNGTKLAVPSEITETTSIYGGLTLHHVTYAPRKEWVYAEVGDTLLVSASVADVRIFLDRLGVESEEIGLGLAQDFFFTRLDSRARELPLLAPFQTISAGKRLDTSGLGVEINLAR